MKQEQGFRAVCKADVFCIRVNPVCLHVCYRLQCLGATECACDMQHCCHHIVNNAKRLLYIETMNEVMVQAGKTVVFEGLHLQLSPATKSDLEFRVFF